MTSSATEQRAEVLLVASRAAVCCDLERALAQPCGVPVGSRVVIAVSGGSDSVALAVLAAALKHRRSPSVIDPVIAHVDHQLRAESGAEAEGVRCLAELLDLPFKHATVSVTSSGHGVAAAAREARYDALESMALAVGASWVATAHHATDQAETLLLALARGTGVQGLLGMQPTRPLGGSVHLVRPLLETSREDLRAVLERANVAWVEDPTNADASSPRACIRHDVLPRLEAIYPGATRHLAGLPAVLRPELASPEVPNAERWSRSYLASLEPAARHTVVREGALRLDPSVRATPRRLWEAVAHSIGGSTSVVRRHVLSESIAVIVNSKEVVLHHEPVNSSTCCAGRSLRS